jgi:multicomponent K+:H+ antiporter subunit E
MRKLLPHPALTVMLVLVWLLLLNDVSAGGLLVGIVVGIVVPVLTAPFWPNRPRINFGWAFWEYLGVVAWDVAVANFQVARLILFRPTAKLRSQWLVIPLELRSPEAITTLAGTISLTPGTVSADMSACGRTLLVHALDVPDEAAEVARIKHRYERRLMRIFR